MSLYTELVAAGVPVDNHYSDLYVKRTPEALVVLKKYPSETAMATHFYHATLRELWIDVPFMYEPFWTSRTRAK